MHPLVLAQELLVDELDALLPLSALALQLLPDLTKVSAEGLLHLLDGCAAFLRLPLDQVP